MTLVKNNNPNTRSSNRRIKNIISRPYLKKNPNEAISRISLGKMIPVNMLENQLAIS